MSADEALAAIANAARVVRASADPLPPCPDPRILQWIRVPRPALVALYAALDVADPPAPPLPPPPPVYRPGEWLPLPRCSVRGCWRLADLPEGTCYHCSPWAAPPKEPAHA